MPVYQSACRARHSIRASAVLQATLFLLTASIQPAWSFERIVPDDPASVFSMGDKSATTAHAVQTDSCRTFLQPSALEQTPTRNDTEWQTNGQAAAALSFVFGVRFALGPRQLAGAHHATVAVWQPGATGNDQAMAIADYRHCRNESALRAWGR